MSLTRYEEIEVTKIIRKCYEENAPMEVSLTGRICERVLTLDCVLRFVALLILKGL